MRLVKGEELSQSVVLNGVQWETYERLLADQENSSGPRLYYDTGTLEIMSPSSKHENLKEAVVLFFHLAAAEMEIDCFSLGSTTFRRKDLEKGFEPDACFYLSQLELVRRKDAFDLRVDPPPDLVIEIDVRHAALKKLPLFLSFGVPEIWLYLDDHFEIRRLDSGVYRKVSESAFLPRVTGEVLLEFAGSRKHMNSVAWIKSVREWAAKR
jgi:Uma2 family endonuclease